MADRKEVYPKVFMCSDSSRQKNYGKNSGHYVIASLPRHRMYQNNNEDLNINPLPPHVQFLSHLCPIITIITMAYLSQHLILSWSISLIRTACVQILRPQLVFSSVWSWCVVCLVEGQTLLWHTLSYTGLVHNYSRLEKSFNPSMCTCF